ncbi:hypothetical protein [Moraxella lacunata]|uniref:hypothetical protein n=1 Tax=Moraxella lacunata TaxID=477 RepID=UPI003EE0DB3E
MYFAIKSTPKVSVSNFWGAVQGLPFLLFDNYFWFVATVFHSHQSAIQKLSTKRQYRTFNVRQLAFVIHL